jgi:hypothetical protein
MTHAHTHTRTHADTHAHTHTHTYMRACKIDHYCKNRLVLFAPLFTMFLSFHHVHRIACQSSLCFVSLPLILSRASFESVSGIGSPHRSRPSSSQAARTPLHIIARVYVIVCGHVVDVFVTAVHAYSFGLLSCVRMRLRLRLLLLLLQLQLRFVDLVFTHRTRRQTHTNT